MTLDEFEHTKRRLEEARRTGLDLVETAYQAQMRALELVWSLQSGPTGEPAPPPPIAPSLADPPPAPPPAQRQKPQRGEVQEELQRIFADLPETFTRKDVCTLLGYEPERSALYRALEALRMRGAIAMAKNGLGPRATVYRKLG